MACLKCKDKLIIVLVLVSVFGRSISDSDVFDPQNYPKDLESAADLLQGRDDDGVSEETVEKETKFSSGEMEAVAEEGQIKNLDTGRPSQQDAIDYDRRMNADYEADNTSIEKSIDSNQTTETTAAMPEAEIPEALRLKNSSEENVDFNEYSQPNRNSNDKTDNDATELTTIDAADATEGVSLSTIDNNVYKAKDIVPEDIYFNHSARNDDEMQTEMPATPQATRASGSIEVLESAVEAEHQFENPGQRSPKIDSADSKQTLDKRNNDAKPRSTPIVSKSTTLRSWLEDSWLRPPAGLLVPLRPKALKRALDVWNDLSAGGALKISDIVIVGYDSNGINWRSRHMLQPNSLGGDRSVAEALSKLILKYQGVRRDLASDGTMRALASAAKLVPYDSALFVITDRGVGDPQKLPLALRALIEKRLKVYTIWTDPRHPSVESEAALQELRNISTHTEGEVLSYSLQVKDMENSLPSETELQQWEPLAEPLLSPRRARMRHIEDGFDTLLVWRGGGEAISLGIPVEAGVAALRVLIEGAVDHAALFPPNDAPQVDLYNTTSVQEFSPGSRIDSWSPRDVYLAFPGASDIDMLSVVPATPPDTEVSTGFVGVWHLSVRCDSCDYRLTVFAHTLIHFQAEADKDGLSLRIIGPVASVRESSLVDEYGTELAKLPFTYPLMTNDGLNDPKENLMTEIEEDVPMPKVKGSKIYVKILGRNMQGDPFIRFSGPINQETEVRNGRSTVIFPDSGNDLERAEEENSRIYSSRLQYNDSEVLPYGRAVSQVMNQRGVILTTVQIGLSTKLYGSPGDSLQLYFEVTNYREQAVRFNFGAVGELRFLRSIEPVSQTISSGQTVNVIVNVLITATAQPGARDLITFTAYGLEQVSISAYVYVMNPGETKVDTWAPEVRHNFQGSCIGRMGTDCSEHVWSVTIVARDAVAGLLRLSSSPLGLTYDSNFVSGTRGEVVATYRASCCAPRLLVSAVDALGNTNSYVVDVSSYISNAGIAAIVLGILLFIALVALITFLIYWCVKRRRSSKEFSSYNTSSRNIS
ncbi:unnamed protein product [Parnassius apollo]|uniref:(apollo) hypothetical protein n=1 Tax=Parnassius apollo TaxID=110799 RepID=A0A8S3X593_PARAO|nr:unnamed protein product [Parnassius apollo]